MYLVSEFIVTQSLHNCYITFKTLLFVSNGTMGIKYYSKQIKTVVLKHVNVKRHKQLHVFIVYVAYQRRLSPWFSLSKGFNVFTNTFSS